MKYNRDYKIQTKLGPTHRNSDGYKEIFYRILPSELPWWKRWFFNPWRKFFICYGYSPTFGTLFTIGEYNRYIVPLKTFGDVCDFHERERAKYVEMKRREAEEHEKAVVSGKAWPDD